MNQYNNYIRKKKVQLENNICKIVVRLHNIKTNFKTITGVDRSATLTLSFRRLDWDLKSEKSMAVSGRGTIPVIRNGKSLHQRSYLTM